MAIAYDTSAQNGMGASSSGSLTMTCSGSNRLLLGYATIVDSGTVDVSSMTYDGVSMTFLNKIKVGNKTISMYYLIAPNTTTSATFAITLTGTPAGGGAWLSGACANYTGCKQSGVPDSSNTGNVASGTSITVSTTTVADNCWLVGIEMGGSPVAGTNTIIRQNAGADMAVIDSNSAQTPAGSKSMQVTDVSSGAKQMIVASIAPYVAPVANGNFLMFM